MSLFILVGYIMFYMGVLSTFIKGRAISLLSFLNFHKRVLSVTFEINRNKLLSIKWLFYKIIKETAVSNVILRTWLKI